MIFVTKFKTGKFTVGKGIRPGHYDLDRKAGLSCGAVLGPQILQSALCNGELSLQLTAF